MKSVITENPKAWHKLSNTIKGRCNCSNCSSYSATKPVKFFRWRSVNITKRDHAFKGSASAYNVEILNYLKP